MVTAGYRTLSLAVWRHFWGRLVVTYLIVLSDVKLGRVSTFYWSTWLLCFLELLLVFDI